MTSHFEERIKKFMGVLNNKSPGTQQAMPETSFVHFDQKMVKKLREDRAKIQSEMDEELFKLKKNFERQSII